MKIIFPNVYYKLKNCPADHRIPKDGSLFSLAGPNLGGGDWQKKACLLLEQKVSGGKAVVACPNHFSKTIGVQSDEVETFEDRLHWKQYYHDLASREGCLIFWLPVEDKNFPRSDGRPYAMMTRDEISTFRERLARNHNLRIVIGAEEGFPGLAEIKRLNEISLVAERLPIYSSLEETITAAVTMLSSI